eukprot:scaffold196267_cov32-Tisochrysis_lutea.AAC.12
MSLSALSLPPFLSLTSMRRLLLLASLSPSASFGGLSAAREQLIEPYVENPPPPAFAAAAARCTERIGSSLGSEWMLCVVNELLCVASLAPLHFHAPPRLLCTSSAFAVPPRLLLPPDRSHSAAQRNPPDDVPPLPFEVVPHLLDPFRPDPAYRSKPGYRSSDELRFLLRDYSCDTEDGGSQV